MPALTLDDADGRYSSGDLCSHIVARVEAAALVAEPFAHFVVDEALPTEFYEAFAASIPDQDSFAGVTHGQDRNADHTLVLSYGAYTSRSPAHRAVLEKIRLTFSTASRHIEAKLRPAISDAFETIFGENYEAYLDLAEVEHVPVANLYERQPWFEQSPHLDGCFRLGTWLYYIPLHPEGPIRGTDIYRTIGTNNSFDPLACMFMRTPRGITVELQESVEFRANRILAFANSPYSFHGVSSDDPEHPMPGRRVTMLNWIELSKPATERIYGRALFQEPRSSCTGRAGRFETCAILEPDSLERAPDVLIEDEGRITTRESCWSYAAWHMLEPCPDKKRDHIVRVVLSVDAGVVALGLQQTNSDQFLTEVTVAATDHTVSIDLSMPDSNQSVRLMFRNASDTGASSFRLRSASIGIAS